MSVGKCNACDRNTEQAERQEQDFYLAAWARVLVGIAGFIVLFALWHLASKGMDIWAAWLKVQEVMKFQ